MDELTRAFKALANERRVRIVRLLNREKELPVYDVADNLKMSFKTASHHLLKLENAGLLKKRQSKLYNFYSLNRETEKPYLQSLLGLFA